MATETVPVPPQIIIIKKKKGGHAAHHGGAWKVAYADFVTAMMALFIVLWLLNSSVEVQKAVGGYFQDPTGKGKEVGSSAAGAGDAMTLAAQDMGKLKEKLEQAVKEAPQFASMKKQIEMTVTGEGLRIELLENEVGVFFERGNASPSQTARELLARLAEELGKLPNRILLEGHTDSKPFNGSNGYSNWELSSDRANVARKLMQTAGLRDGQVLQVRGFADQDLRTPKTPEAASNRRISIIVRYNTPTGVLPPAGAKDAHGAPTHGEVKSGHETPKADKDTPAAVASTPAAANAPAHAEAKDSTKAGPVVIQLPEKPKEVAKPAGAEAH